MTTDFLLGQLKEHKECAVGVIVTMPDGRAVDCDVVSCTIDMENFIIEEQDQPRSKGEMKKVLNIRCTAPANPAKTEIIPLENQQYMRVNGVWYGLLPIINDNLLAALDGIYHQKK